MPLQSGSYSADTSDYCCNAIDHRTMNDIEQESPQVLRAVLSKLWKSIKTCINICDFYQIYRNANIISCCARCTSSSIDNTASVSISLNGKKRLLSELCDTLTNSTGTCSFGHAVSAAGGRPILFQTTMTLLRYGRRFNRSNADTSTASRSYVSITTITTNMCDRSKIKTETYP